jgi:hypothetical protein
VEETQAPGVLVSPPRSRPQDLPPGGIDPYPDGTPTRQEREGVASAAAHLQRRLAVEGPEELLPRTVATELHPVEPVPGRSRLGLRALLHIGECVPGNAVDEVVLVFLVARTTRAAVP